MTTTSANQSDPLVGRTICGCAIVRLLGQGGMGSVYIGRQLSLDRIVAVKVLSPALSSNEEFLGRFRREARSLANLKHPNIVAVHDFGEEGAIHAVVMEHVDGESVADMLARTPILPLPQVLDIVRQVAEGLACAHRQGIIHCDLKPENILVTADGVAKVIDFGLAKSLRGDALRITQEGAILGTPHYMSPEQCEGIPLDARTDIYSLGASFYRMVAGVDVFDADNAFAIMLKHKDEPPADPRRFNPDLPAAVARVLLRMLAKRPEDRYQHAGEIAAALSEDALAAPEREAEVSPRHEVDFLRDALEAELIAPDQARACVAELGDEPVADLLIRRKLLTPEQAEQVRARGAAREQARRDQQFVRFAIDAGLVASEQVARCLRIQQASRERGHLVKLSRILVDEGVLDQRDVVRVLLRQLKDAQRREDADFLLLVSDRGLLSEAEVSRAKAQQRRAEASGHHKLLRQVVVELGLLSDMQVAELVAAKLRAALAAVASEDESKDRDGGGVLFDEEALRVEETEPCAACGKPVEVGARACPACGRRVADALRQAALGGEAAGSPAARQAGREGEGTGKWAIRMADGEPSKPLTGKAIVQLAREKRLKPETVLRGPLTGGVWRQARHVPRLCRLFGVCHFCEGSLPSKATCCPACGADPDQPAGE